MSTPAFITTLRQKIGHDPLWLIGITAVVLDDDDNILLAKRADTGQWACIYGINEPGEQPADTVVREVYEEAGLNVRVEELFAVTSSDQMITYANKDQAQYMDHAFICRPLESTKIQPLDGENTEVGWFSRDNLPTPLAKSTKERLRLFDQFRANCARGDAHALFARPTATL